MIGTLRFLKLVTWLTLALIGWQAKAELSKDALAFLQGQPIVRVWISPAPGFGHQAATVTVMKRLRQLGYQGQFEVVYDATIASKLTTLLPGFNVAQNHWQDLPELGMRAIELKEFRKVESRTLAFGLTGADDNLKFMKPEVLHVERYLRLQPLGWGSSYILEAGRKPKLLADQNNIGYFYEIETSAEALEKNIAQLSESDLKAKSEGLRAILETPNIEIGSVYGIGLIGNMPGRMRFWISALQTAQRSSNADFKGGVVLPILSGLNANEIRALTWELASLKPKAIVMKIDDPLLPEAVKKLKRGQTLVVVTGRVTQNIFETLFKRSRVPLLVAGKNAMNLARLVERPYLNTVGDYGFAGDTDEKVKTLVREAAESFHSAPSAAISRQRTARFILAAMDAQSPLSAFYKTLGLQGRDKIAEALEILVEDSGQTRGKMCTGAFGL